MRLLVSVVLLIQLVVSTSTSAQTRPSLSADVVFIADTRPCLATVLAYIGHIAVQPGPGTLRLEGIPTRQSVAVLLDWSGDDFLKNSVVLQANLYSEQSYYVEIVYTISQMTKGVFFVSAGGEIVDRYGSHLAPRHVIEPLTTAAVRADSIVVVDNPKTL